MSIRILLDHGIKQDHIIFVTFLVARGGGISVLRRAFPSVKIVCGAVDDEMKEGWLDVEGYHGEGNSEDHPRKVWVMQPGMGQIVMFSSCHSFLVHSKTSSKGTVTISTSHGLKGGIANY